MDITEATMKLKDIQNQAKSLHTATESLRLDNFSFGLAFTTFVNQGDLTIRAAEKTQITLSI